MRNIYDNIIKNKMSKIHSMQFSILPLPYSLVYLPDGPRNSLILNKLLYNI